MSAESSSSASASASKKRDYELTQDGDEEDEKSPKKLKRKAVAENDEKQDEPQRLEAFLATALKCGVCLDTMVNPVSIHCGHSFCAACLRTTMVHDPFCPMCKVYIDPTYESHLSNTVLREITQKVISSDEYTTRCEQQFKNAFKMVNEVTKVRFQLSRGAAHWPPEATDALKMMLFLFAKQAIKQHNVLEWIPKLFPKDSIRISLVAHENIAGKDAVTFEDFIGDLDEIDYPLCDLCLGTKGKKTGVRACYLKMWRADPQVPIPSIPLSKLFDMWCYM
jgi:hypothetical protein